MNSVVFFVIIVRFFVFVCASTERRVGCCCVESRPHTGRRHNRPRHSHRRHDADDVVDNPAQPPEPQTLLERIKRADDDADVDRTCDYVDTRRDGFPGNFLVTLNALRLDDGTTTQLSITDALSSAAHAVSLNDDVTIQAFPLGTSFRLDELCVESRGLGGIFWQFEEPAPPPRVVTVGDGATFMSSVGGVLYHHVVRELSSIN